MIFPDPPMPEREELGGLLPDDRYESLPSYLVHQMGVLERQERRVFGQIFSVYGLHPSQGIALKTIIRAPGMSQRELADRLRIQRATITVILQKLERGDFIRREPDPYDQRVIRIFPTQKGEAANRLTDEACTQLLEHCFDDIPPDQQQEMARLLRRMEENIRRFEASLQGPPEGDPGDRPPERNHPPHEGPIQCKPKESCP